MTAQVKEIDKETDSGPKNKILIVDDDRDMREVLASRLRHNNYNVMIAENGVVGLEIARQHKPNLIILDVLMPEMTGFQFFNKLKTETEEIRNIPIIVVSGKKSMKEFFEDWAIFSFLVKPFDSSILLSEVRRAIGGDAPLSPPPSSTGSSPTTSEKSPAGNAKKILVATCQDSMRNSLKTFIESKRFAVLVTSEAKEAISLALSERPDLILVQFDEDKSKMDAPDIYKTLQGDPAGKAIPFAVFNTRGLMSEVVKSFKASQVITFDKLADLITKLETYLQEHKIQP